LLQCFKVLANWVGVRSCRKRPTPEDVIVKQKSITGIAQMYRPQDKILNLDAVFG
jgi:hypothetical protein